MLAASFRETGGFARLTGRPGGVQAPAAWELPEGREAGTAVPTEAFYAMRTQSRLAERGSGAGGPDARRAGGAGGGAQGVQVSVVVKPEHAGLLLELGFTLPLRG